MPTPVGSPSRPFEFQRLQQLVTLVDGSPFKTTETEHAANVEEIGPQDVMILRSSQEAELFQAASNESAEIAGELQKKGVAVDETLEGAGIVTAHVDATKAKELESEGFRVFDNSRRSLIPGVPARRITDSGTDDTTMPKVDPVAMTHADAVQRQGFTGKGEVWAVIDSGYDHPDVPLVAWKDILDGSGRPVDPVGHGTHVSGDIKQLAPDAGIVAVRVMDEDGQGRPSDIIRGIQWVVQNKDRYHINGINMSLGGQPVGIPSSQNPFDRAVETAIKKGITVVAAAGNEGPTEHTIGSPADDPYAITVGSGLDPKHLSDFSSRGPTDDDRHKPDVVAPGEFIVSWNVTGSQMDKMGQVVEKLRHMSDDQLVQLLRAKPQLIEALNLPPDIGRMSSDERLRALHKTLPPIYMPDDRHIAAPGTSFASPITSGLAADLMQADPSLSPQRTKQVLTATADSMGAYGADDQGAGFVNAEKALNAVRGSSPAARHTAA